LHVYFFNFAKQQKCEAPAENRKKIEIKLLRRSATFVWSDLPFHIMGLVLFKNFFSTLDKNYTTNMLHDFSLTSIDFGAQNDSV
jgi:hypothetical protein